MATKKTHTSVQGEMIDEICWRFYGDESGYVEGVLESPDNYRLCDRAEILDIGVQVVLPDIVIAPVPIARLWD